MSRYYTKEERELIPQHLLGDIHNLKQQKKELMKRFSAKRSEIRKYLKGIKSIPRLKDTSLDTVRVGA